MTYHKIKIYANTVEWMTIIRPWLREDVCVDSFVLDDLSDVEEIGFSRYDESLPEDGVIPVVLPFFSGESPENAVRLDYFFKFFYNTSVEQQSIIRRFFQAERSEIEAGVVGLSYIQVGINTKRTEKSTICMASPSQDVFYDKHMVDLALSYFDNLETIIWGISPYSLWYDLSLSRNRVRALGYLPITGTLHHFEGGERFYNLFLETQNMISEFFADGFEEYLSEFIFVHVMDGENYEYMRSDVYTDDIDEARDREEVQKLFHKPYEDTYHENAGIIREEISAVSEKQKRIIFVLPPFSSVFRRYMDISMYEKTVLFLQSLEEEYPNVRVLDYTFDERFEDNLFADYAHLNRMGADLLTDVLNADIV